MQSENHYTETDLGNVAPNPRGNFDSTAKYEYLDLVAMQGGSYLCIAELGQTITGIAPEAGKNTEHWQCVAIPGNMTPEYTDAYDKVVRLAREVEQDAAKVAEDKQSVTQMETNTRRLKEQTEESARLAENSKDSAAGSAREAKKAEESARQAENNVGTLVNGFNTHVTEKTAEAIQAVATAKDNAIQAVERQETASVQEVKDQTGAYITEQKNLAKQELDDKVNQFKLDVDAIKAEVTEEGQKQITSIQKATTTELAKITEKGTEQTEAVAKEGTKQVQAVQTAAQEIIADREQIAKNATDIADLRQNKADAITETASGTLLNVKDSANAFFEDFFMAGKTTQDGTPTPDVPMPIVNAGKDGTIEIKITGKNLLPNTRIPDKTENGITMKYKADGVYHLSGTSTNRFDSYTLNLSDISFPPGKYRILTGKNVKSQIVVTKKNTEQDIWYGYEFTINKGDKIKYWYCIVSSGKIVDEDIHVYMERDTGNTLTVKDFEPPREPQTITLQLDRPLTKWDKLEKREDIWGIARKSKAVDLSTEDWFEYKNTVYPEGIHCYSSIFENSMFKYNSSLCTHFKNASNAWDNEIAKIGIYSDHILVRNKYFISDKSTVEGFKTWLLQQKEAGTPVEVVYETETETWEPLPEETQRALNALHTNYPTTVVTNNAGAGMELSYVADTKNYTDNKIKEAVSAQTQSLANLLSLMPLSTQAAMIETDTNNILDNMEVTEYE